MRKLKLPGRDRTRPRLDENDIQLIKQLGIDEIKDHVRKIVEQELKDPDRDTSTPRAGNPVYKAMHACNVTSRKQMLRSHRIRPEKELTDNQVDSVVDLLIRWVVREYNFYQEEKKQQQRNLGEFA